MYASTNISKLNVSTISIVVFLMHQNQITTIIAMNAMATITTKPIHTLTSHILHSIHNQGIFTEFPVLLLQLSAFETLLP